MRRMQAGKSERINLVLTPEHADVVRRRAQELGKPIGRYLGELAAAEARRARDELAIAGYRDAALNAEALAFARETFGAGPEGWPEWEEA